jgi:L-amino acid N-acyltransferase YncA
MNTDIALRDANHDDLPTILAIHNEAVRNSVAIWTNTEATLENRRALMDTCRAAGFPFIAAVRGTELLGYGSFGDFRSGDGYAGTVEHSVYVHHAARGHGIGAMLLGRLMEEAKARDKHVMMGGIAADNTASLALHARFGFAETGRLPEVGFKFGRWLDLVLMQRVL